MKFGDDYESAFTYIKKEITDLLDEVDKGECATIEFCKLSYNVKHLLLIIYCPEKVLPICHSTLLLRYCERTHISHHGSRDTLYLSNLLIQWKNDVPELSNLSNSLFASFCDWLYKKNQFVDSDSLRCKTNVNEINIIEEIDNLNLQGESHEAVVKVRVNQGIFRERLLQRYNKCCLCDIGNQNLLIASHIKPWKTSEPFEKLDIDNGFLMCPNHDRLFDKGWITFADDGKIIISDGLSKDDRIALNINERMNILLTEKNRKYLQYHRKDIFKNGVEYSDLRAPQSDH